MIYAEQAREDMSRYKRQKQLQKRGDPLELINERQATRGVTFVNKTGMYRARIWHEKSYRSLGTYDTLAEAEAVYHKEKKLLTSARG